MATLGPEVASSSAGAFAGMGGTAFARERLDNPQDDAITRPSVLYGVGSGVAMMGLSYLNSQGTVSVPDWALPAINTWGTVGTVAGVFSALFPKGNGGLAMPVSRQSIRQRV